MKLRIFSIYDKKVEAFNIPFFAHENVGKRHYLALLKDPASAVAMFPDDYQLFEVGEWDDAQCEITMHPQPRLLEV
ncbi:MAG: nonstructural protein [Microvirus sp.]|nr:MAG: nonstructural protein [Microvirus sp.]